MANAVRWRGSWLPWRLTLAWGLATGVGVVILAVLRAVEDREDYGCPLPPDSAQFFYPGAVNAGDLVFFKGGGRTWWHRYIDSIPSPSDWTLLETDAWWWRAWDRIRHPRTRDGIYVISEDHRSVAVQARGTETEGRAR